MDIEKIPEPPVRPMTGKLKHDLDMMTMTHGHAAVVLAIAGRIGWNARWESSAVQAIVGKVVQQLAEAGEALARLEADEEETRKAVAESEAKHR